MSPRLRLHGRWIIRERMFPLFTAHQSHVLYVTVHNTFWNEEEKVAKNKSLTRLGLWQYNILWWMGIKTLRVGYLWCINISRIWGWVTFEKPSSSIIVWFHDIFWINTWGSHIFSSESKILNQSPWLQVLLAHCVLNKKLQSDVWK